MEQLLIGIVVVLALVGFGAMAILPLFMPASEVNRIMSQAAVRRAETPPSPMGIPASEDMVLEVRAVRSAPAMPAGSISDATHDTMTVRGRSDARGHQDSPPRAA